MHQLFRRLGRVLAILTLTAGIPAGTAAAVTHTMLDGTTWTDPAPSAPAQPKATPEPVQPTPTKTPAPKPTTASVWPLGACVTHTGYRIPCTRAGALRIVGSIHHPGPDECRDVPETDHVHHTGAYALCLTAN
ncbi:hypothetical protein ACFWFF_01490 [Streptomyces sp. NPDC060223]|uniref:hypothetical protein n=1 Tax=unclassified Streptomyces TaxID=2593676 RepID=UPI00363652F7